MSEKQARRYKPAEPRINPPNSRGSRPPNEQELKGVSRLVIPRKDEQEVISGEDDDRDYLGRLLHVADEALHQVERGRNHRKRRGRIH